MTTTPTHLLPGRCYVCGGDEIHHRDAGSHAFWSNADAEQELAAEAARHGDARTWADGVHAETRPMPELDAGGAR